MFRPMLAAKTPDLETLQYPMFASYKLDGIRAIMRDGMMMSRSMKPLPNLDMQKYFGRFKSLENCDGELITGKHDNDVYRRTMSHIMTTAGNPMQDTVWNIFDFVDEDLEYRERLKVLVEYVVGNGASIRVLPHKEVRRADDVLALHQEAVKQGYEGLILRSPTGLYKQGRSTAREQGMVKVKMFEDSEAEILGFEMLMHNENAAVPNELGLTKRSSHKANKVMTDKMGCIKVRDIHTGVEFEIGTGFTDTERRLIVRYPVGRIVKYKSFPGGVKDKPRFPVFLGFRDPLDL